MSSESTLRSQRRRKPIFIDEPIQWHRRHTDHDRCPWCGLQQLERYGPRRRICKNLACESAYESRLNPNEWLKAKLSGRSDPAMQYDGPPLPRYSLIDGNDSFTLEEAQIRSAPGRGMLEISRGYVFSRIYWHRVGHLPELKNGTRICEGGSDLHKWMNNLSRLKVWTPEEPLCAMEVIARAANNDPMSSRIDP